MKATLAYPPFVLGATEAALYIGVSPRTLTQLQTLGHLIPQEIAGKRGFLREELETWARNQPEWETKTFPNPK